MAFKASYENERLLRFSHAQPLKFICGSTRKSLKLDLYVALNLSRHVFFSNADRQNRPILTVNWQKKTQKLYRIFVIDPAFVRTFSLRRSEISIFISNVGGILKLAMTREHRSIIEGSVVTLR